MVLTESQKKELIELLNSEDFGAAICGDFEEILFLDINDFHNINMYIQDIERRDGSDRSEDELFDIYAEESDRRLDIIFTLKDTKDVESFCEDIAYIQDSKMEIDLEYFKKDAHDKLKLLTTNLAKQIIIDNSK